MPWYITALLLSQPLHFGDYGGMPLKIIWALLDLVTIVVLVSGVYLWWKRLRQRGDAEAAEAARGRASAPARENAPRNRRWWPLPAALGTVSLAGLLSALLADGAGDVMSWIALGGVAATSLAVLWPRRAGP